MHSLPVVSETAPVIPSSDDMIDHVFASGGLLTKAWPAYRKRKGQYDLAYAIDNAICSGEHLLAEAPCGTGKSVAYLVPATYHAHRTGGRVVVATGNIALQEQLVQKDLPMLQKLLPWPFSFALLKGVNHFVCRKVLPEVEAEIISRRKSAPEVALEMERLRDLLRAALKEPGYDGDRSMLPFEPSYEAWSAFSTSSEECTGSKCPKAETCFSMAHRQKAREAEVVVTNYHMLFVDALVREASDGMAGILPEYETLIMDECHKAPDIAREFFGFSLSAATVKRALRGLKNSRYSMQAARTVEAAQQMFGWIRAEKAGIVATPLIGDEAGDAWRDCEPHIIEAQENLKAWGYHAETHETERGIIVAEQCYRGADRLELFRKQMLEALELSNPDHVYSIEHGNKSSTLKAMPVNIGPLIRARIINKCKTVIATSATVATGKSGGFNYMKSELGASGFRTMSAESPFNWKQQARGIVLKAAPEPNSDRYAEYTGRALAAAVKRVQGRTLGLFTSYRALDAAHEYLSELELPYRLLKQGDMPRSRLIEAFKEDVSSVLLGTESFWTGVDVPGEALSCVFIDRLPFPHPDDPLLKALEAKSEDAFRTYSIPRAILAFKQGFGRLIRSIGDKGIFVLVDNRVLTKRYGSQFLAALPEGMPIEHNMSSVEGFLT